MLLILIDKPQKTLHCCRVAIRLLVTQNNFYFVSFYKFEKLENLEYQKFGHSSA